MRPEHRPQSGLSAPAQPALAPFPRRNSRRPAMAADQQRSAIRTQAHLAREESKNLREHSQALRGVSEHLRDRSTARCEQRSRAASKRLESTTAAVDDGLVGWSVMRPFIEFDSNLVGRSTVIEQAKTLLCDDYGISRGEAFAILRRASSHSNRKLREVAVGLVAESASREGPRVA